MANIPHDPDIPIEVNGIVTDPLRVGFQILSNYESTYWRALVGNDEWSLYEVLRSFCHTDKGKEAGTCWPSINLLAAILGLKERRVLTGYQKTIKQKTYTYPGLIEILQQNELVFAREEGNGPDMRYKFDVVLTPKLLTPEQIDKLPKLLQQKHAELVERCRHKLEKYKATRRPARVSATDEKEVEVEEEGGSVNYRTPSVNYQTPFGKLPNPFGKLPTEQQQKNNNYKNNNKRTTTAQSPADENETLSHAKSDVVVALTDQGISEKVAERLAHRYNEVRIREKIDFLTYLREHDPEKVKNPQGWLRRAIEENYGPPDGHLTPKDLGKGGVSQGDKVVAQEWLALISDEEDETLEEDGPAAESISHIPHLEIDEITICDLGSK